MSRAAWNNTRTWCGQFQEISNTQRARMAETGGKKIKKKNQHGSDSEDDIQEPSAQQQKQQSDLVTSRMPLFGAIEWPCNKPPDVQAVGDGHSSEGEQENENEEEEEEEEQERPQDDEAVESDMGDEIASVVSDNDDMNFHDVYSERPHFPIIMRLKNNLGLRNCTKIDDLRDRVGRLPESCNIMFVNLVNVSVTMDEKLMHMILPKGKLLTLSEEENEFGSQSDPMKQIMQAGHYRPQQENIKKMILQEPKGLREDAYYSRTMVWVKCLQSEILNNTLLNKNAKFGMQYLLQAENRVFDDLRQLRHEVIHQGKPSGIARGGGSAQYAHWRGAQINPFVLYAWEFHAVFMHYCSAIVQLHPQNYNNLCNFGLTDVQFRLAQNNPGWVNLGAWNLLCDAAGKLPSAEFDNMRHLNKRPTSGMDFLMGEKRDQRCMGRGYLGVSNIDDGQEYEALDRMTEASVLNGVRIVDGKVKNKPDNVGSDQYFSEQPTKSVAVMDRLVQQNPRDRGEVVQKETTVDLNKDGNRSNAIEIGIRGFRRQIAVTAQNNSHIPEVEERFQELAILMNVISVKFEYDHAGHTAMVNGNQVRVRKALVPFADPNSTVLGGGANSVTSKATFRALSKLDSKHVSKWAPFLYFLPTLAMTSVGLSSKMGVWDLPLDHAVAEVVHYVKSKIEVELKSVMDKHGIDNFSRVVPKHISRMVAATVLYKSFMYMSNSDTVEEATHRSIKSLSLSGLDMSLIPVMTENIVAEVVRYDLLLMTTLIASELGAPRLQLKTVLELLSGGNVSDQGEEEALQNFFERIDSNGLRMPRNTVDLNGVRNVRDASPYITPVDLGAGAQKPSFRYKFPRSYMPNADKDLAIATAQITKKIYETHRSVLDESALVGKQKHLEKMVNSVIASSKIDLGQFFGGKLRAMTEPRVVRTALGREWLFDVEDNANMFVIYKISPNEEEYAMGVHVHYLLLFIALMDKPSRDFGIVNRFARTISQYLMCQIPLSLMPFEKVPGLSMDVATPNEPVLYELQSGDQHALGNTPRPPHLLRPYSPDCYDCVKHRSEDGPTGVVEDDGFMAAIITAKKMMGYDDMRDLSLFSLEVHLNLQWGATYPLDLYSIPEENFLELDENDRGAGVPAYVLHMKGGDRSMNVFSIRASEQSDDRFVAETIWRGQIDDDYSRQSNELSIGKDFLELTTLFLRSGLGPVPFVCRPGVAIKQGADRVGCIVPHDPRVIGCERGPRCYCCKHTPFYNLLVGPGDDDYDILPYCHILDDTVIKPGVMLKLEKTSEELQMFCIRLDLEMTNPEEDHVKVCMSTPIELDALDGFITVCVQWTSREKFVKYEYVKVRPWSLRLAGSYEINGMRSRLFVPPSAADDDDVRDDE